MSSGKVNSSTLIGGLIAQRDNIVDGIKYAQEKIKGTMSLLILTEDGIIAARDKNGRLPIIIGRRDDGYCVSFESFAFQKLGYAIYREMLPGEIVKITSKRAEVLSEGHINDLKICTFLWTYYGYPNSVYEGVTVETMRTRNGEIMAEHDIQSGNLPDVDFICGVPDSGVPHAIGYANRSGIPFARPFIKYTPTWPRSFMPQSQSMRNKVAKMKLIPVHELIEGKKLLFVDDSIVITATSSKKEMAEQFIDFLLEPEVAAKNIEFIGYSSANTKVLDILGDEWANNTAYNVPEEAVKKSVIYRDLSDKIDIYNAQWDRIFK